MKKLILSSEEYAHKLALIEENKVSEFLIELKNTDVALGAFYKGKIVDIIDGIESIFVDIGLEKNAFLNISKFKDRMKFNKNDEILVQVENEPRDEKGAKLTLDYSISGKNLVLLPNSTKVSISHKIFDEKEKERLKEIFADIKDMGLIIRTSAAFVDKNILREEYENLIFKWENIKKDFKNSKCGKKIYSQNSLIERIFREYFDEKTDELIIDNKDIFEKIKKYIEENKLESLKNKLKRFYKDEDIFEYYKVNIEIENALKKKVWLTSGAYIIIEKTEALISIDVNTGMNTEGKDLEKLITQTNLEAAIEIPRQLRLRNLSGIIIIDFIDMKKENNRKIVLKTLENELKNDRMKTNIVNFSSLNLVQLTRQRHGNDLSSYYQEPCIYCGGTGFVKSEESIILEILKELKNIVSDKDIKKIELISKTEIIRKIKRDFIEYIEGILKNKEFHLIETTYLKDYYKINLYR